MEMRYQFRKIDRHGFVNIGETRAKDLIEDGWRMEYQLTKPIHIVCGEPDMALEITINLFPRDNYTIGDFHEPDE